MKMIDIAEFRERVKSGKQRPQTGVRFVGSKQEVVGSDEAARTVSFVFSDNSVDRYGDTIDARGWVLDNFKANPVALFGHDAGSVENVIGRAQNVRVEGQRLIGDIEFMPGETNPTAEAVYQMVKGGFLKTVSVGFAPIEWKLTKDKGRPGGVDFTKQELLEISIVPIPANPNALQQAKAAGIDLSRLGLERDAVVVSKKGLYEVAWLAQLLSELSYLEDVVEWEAEYEGDASDVPQRLTDALRALGQVLVDMTNEEVSELFAEEEPLIATDDSVALASMTPAQKAICRLVAAGNAHRRKHTIALDIAMTPEARDILAQIERAGKVLSGANESALRAACDHMTKAMDHVTGVIGANGTDDEPGDVEAKAKADAAAARARRAKALKLKLITAAPAA
jgi:HK97 family phage prohead protease